MHASRIRITGDPFTFHVSPWNPLEAPSSRRGAVVFMADFGGGEKRVPPNLKKAAA